MRSGTIALLVGGLILHCLPELPARGWCWLLIGLIPAAVVDPRLRLPSLVVIGFLWTLLQAGMTLERRVPPSLEGRDVVAEGRIASVPQPRTHSVRFAFRVERLWYQDAPVPTPGLVRLSWYGAAPALHAGERWRLRLRLKRPSGFRNPGGFDYERWLFQHGYGATGYVRPDPENRRRGAPGPAGLNGLRERLDRGLDRALEGAAHGPLIRALALGLRHDIAPAAWEVLARTGTSHLVAISGLHVGLVAGLVLVLVRRLWRLSPRLTRRWPALKAGAVAALGAAAGYAALAGFSVPTRRALVMLAVGLGAVLFQRAAVPSRSLALALAAIVIVDPLAVLGAGFWLSFAAVGVLLYGVVGRWGPAPVWWRWGRAQWVAGLGLAPLTLLFFQQASVVAPVANLVAVPWVGLAVVPLVLVGLALLGAWPAGAGAVLGLADALLGMLWPILAWLGGQPFAQLRLPEPAWWQLAAALLGVVLVFGPRGLPGRGLALPLCLPLLFAGPEKLPPGTVELRLLDVGQGLSAVVRTRDHTLVYDVGPRFSTAFDAGSAVVAPYLRWLGRARVDRLILSHGDTDHVGGLRGLLRDGRVVETLAGEPAAVEGIPVRACHAGRHWQWDGVGFRVLHPPRDSTLEGNDRSCVIKIDTAGGSILLTGDIQGPAERRLVRQVPGQLRAAVLVAPHHGSNTSSGAAFVRAVAPDYVLFPVGYRNRYGFPHPAVVARYRAHGARMLDSAHQGAIQVRIDAEGVRGVHGHRQTARRYWHRR